MLGMYSIMHTTDMQIMSTGNFGGKSHGALRWELESARQENIGPNQINTTLAYALQINVTPRESNS